MQSVKAIQIDSAPLSGGGLGDGNARPHLEISVLFERNHRVQPVHAAALKKDDEHARRLHFSCARGAEKKNRRQSSGEKAQAGGFEEASPGKIHPLTSFETPAQRVTAHICSTRSLRLAPRGRKA
jgi:hypothetical protein